MSMKVFLLINVKMPTIVGILTFMSWKNSIISPLRFDPHGEGRQHWHGRIAFPERITIHLKGSHCTNCEMGSHFLLHAANTLRMLHIDRTQTAVYHIYSILMCVCVCVCEGGGLRFSPKQPY